MPRGKPHPPELRARVVAELAAGAPINEVCRKYGVHKSTAISWKADYRPIEPDDARTRERMAELIYDTLTDLLSTVRAQLRLVAREDWLAQQSAGDVAGLLGVELDRAIRILAGFRPAEPEQPELPSPGDLDPAAGPADPGPGV